MCVGYMEGEDYIIRKFHNPIVNVFGAGF